MDNLDIFENACKYFLEKMTEFIIKIGFLAREVQKLVKLMKQARKRDVKLA